MKDYNWMEQLDGTIGDICPRTFTFSVSDYALAKFSNVFIFNNTNRLCIKKNQIFETKFSKPNFQKDLCLSKIFFFFM